MAVPEKIPAKVVEISSEDDEYRAIELNFQEPTCKGWHSMRGSSYPQHMIFELEKEARMRKIQIFSHHHMIAKKIEFFVGKTSADKTLREIFFTPLGSVMLSTNETNSFKVRELKSVYVDAPGKFLKLVFIDCHRNEFNVHNQVGLMAVNILGEFLSNEDTVHAKEMPDKRKMDHYSPLDDLSFLMYHDAEVAHIIRQLDRRKRILQTDVGSNENDEETLNRAILHLEKNGKTLAKLESEKKRAIEAQNFEKAKLLNQKMDKLRLQTYKEANLDQLRVNTVLPERDHAMPVKIVGTILHTIKDVPPAASPKHLPKTSPMKPHFKMSKPADHHLAREDQHHQITSHSTNAYLDYNERPLPTNRRHSRTRSEDAGEEDESNMRDCESALSMNDLSETDLKEASYVIDAFGIETASEIFSKKWLFKFQGLEKVMKVFQEECCHLSNRTANSNSSNNANNNSDNTNDCLFDKESLENVMKAMEQIFVRVAKDNVISVFQLALSIYKQFLLVFLSSHDIYRQHSVHHFLEKTLSSLIVRISDNSSRHRELTRTFLFELSESPEFKKYQSILISECLKTSKQNPTPKMSLGLVEVLRHIYGLHGLKESGLTLEILMSFLIGCMAKNFPEVRKSAETFIVRLYRDFGTAVRSNLQKDESVIRDVRMTARVKNLLNEFEEIDKEKPELKSKASEDDKKIVTAEESTRTPVRNQSSKQSEKKSQHLSQQPQQPTTATKQLKAMKENLPRKLIVFKKKPTLKKNTPHHHSIPSLKATTAKQTTTSNKQLQQPLKAQQPQHALPKLQQNQPPVQPKPAQRSRSVDRRMEGKSFDVAEITGEENGEEDADDISRCVFCGEKNVVNSEDVIDEHYLNHCPMLTQCCECNKVVEVSSLTSHLLTSCPESDLYRKCPRCRLAISLSSYAEHSAGSQCRAIRVGEEHCPLCGEVIVANEMSWKRHLAKSNGCKKNGRRKEVV